MMKSIIEAGGTPTVADVMHYLKMVDEIEAARTGASRTGPGGANQPAQPTRGAASGQVRENANPGQYEFVRCFDNREPKFGKPNVKIVVRDEMGNKIDVMNYQPQDFGAALNCEAGSNVTMEITSGNKPGKYFGRNFKVVQGAGAVHAQGMGQSSVPGDDLPF
tara:strand:- start:189 stop:677 length:489 start_codon:yes stop_codon:yes gene_type:complete